MTNREASKDRSLSHSKGEWMGTSSPWEVSHPLFAFYMIDLEC